MRNGCHVKYIHIHIPKSKIYGVIEKWKQPNNVDNQKMAQLPLNIVCELIAGTLENFVLSTWKSSCQFVTKMNAM